MEDKFIRLYYHSRSGKSDSFNKSDVSILCIISVVDESWHRMMITSIPVEYCADGNDVDEAIALLENADKRFLSSQQEDWRKMIRFLRANKERIEEGNRIFRINSIRLEIDKLQKELDCLTKFNSFHPSGGDGQVHTSIIP